MDRAGAAVRPGRPVADHRGAADVGRTARLELVFACRNGRTLLTHAYAEPPFRTGRCFQEGAGVHMILVWSAPGIFAGDDLRQRVVVERGAVVRLTSQSACQVHPGAGARLSSTYLVEDDAELRCAWKPLIPFAGARLTQRQRVRLAAGARLWWSDALMAGRVHAGGERWAFAELSHELAIEREGAVEYLERYRLAPGARSIDRAWAAGGHSYFGTAIASGWAVAPERASALRDGLAQIDGVSAGVDCLGERLLLVRLMAGSGARFREARALAARIADSPVPS